MSNNDGLSKVELNLIRLATPLDNYGTVSEAIEALANAREYQISQWKNVAKPDAGGRLPEEWQLLLNHYTTKLNAVYSESDGEMPEGRARYAKYAAIVANLAFWLVQSLIGAVNDDKRVQAGIESIKAVKAGETVIIDCAPIRDIDQTPVAQVHPDVVMDESGFSSGAGFAAVTK